MSVTELPVKTSRRAHRDGSRAVPSGMQKGQQTKTAIVDAALGLILALHYEVYFLKTPSSMDRTLRAFQSILTRYGSEAALALAQPIASPSSV